MLINNLCTRVNESYNNYLLASNPNQEWVSLLPDYIDISPFAAGVATIGFIFGAYMTETFRGAIGGGQGRAGSGPRLWHAGHPCVCADPVSQMMRHAPPWFGNNWLVLLKTTALVSIIGLDDMVRKASPQRVRPSCPSPSTWRWP